MNIKYKNKRLRMIYFSKSNIKAKLEFRFDIYQMENFKIPNLSTKK